MTHRSTNTVKSCFHLLYKEGLFLFLLFIMSIVYIDFECDNNDEIIEVGAVCVKDNHVQSVLHTFVDPFIQDVGNYERTAKYSHCIPHRILKLHGCSKSMVKQKFLEWIHNETIHPVTIKGNGSDVTKFALEKWIPALGFIQGLQYEQVTLHLWADRVYEKYHISAGIMKEVSLNMKCCRGYHSLPKTKQWRGISMESAHTKIAKDMHGFHCALFDAFELAFYEKTLKYYCCDKHFINHFFQ